MADDAAVTIHDDWLDSSAIADLRGMGARRSFPAGTVLFTEGDDPYDVILIESGDVKLVSTAASGNELVLDLLGPGDLLGELSSIDGGPRSATAVALTGAEVVAVPGSRFAEYLEANPSTMAALLRLTVERLRQANLRQLEYSSVDALGRVCRRLEEIARRGEAGAGEEVTVDLGLTQMEFAQWCGLSREAVVKALRKLRALEWISQSESEVTIHDRAQLRRRGEG